VMLSSVAAAALATNACANFVDVETVEIELRVYGCSRRFDACPGMYKKKGSALVC
jgi:hypothetical protein